MQDTFLPHLLLSKNNWKYNLKKNSSKEKYLNNPPYKQGIITSV